MPQQQDRVQREIEELLGKLDNFVPEERFISKIKSRRKAQAGPGLLSRSWTTVSKPFRRITLGHVMILGLVLMVSSWLAPGLYGDYRGLASFAGFVLMALAFVMSLLGWDSRRTIAGGRVQRRWRGQVMEYDQPSSTSKVREWFRKRGRK